MREIHLEIEAAIVEIVFMPRMIFVLRNIFYNAVHCVYYTVQYPKENTHVKTSAPNRDCPVGCVTVLVINTTIMSCVLCCDCWRAYISSSPSWEDP